MLTVSPAPDALAPRALDDVRGVAGVLVLPCPDDDPSRLSETSLGPAVAIDVGIELGAPPVGVRPRGDGVFAAAVPEAPVDEHGDASSGEGDVGPAGDGCHVDAVAETAAMQLATERQFGLGPGRPKLRHEAADRRTRRSGFVWNR